jgi:hypothetical protein
LRSLPNRRAITAQSPRNRQSLHKMLTSYWAIAAQSLRNRSTIIL